MPPVSAVGRLPLATLEAYNPGRRIDARLLTFRARAADQAHAAFTPGTAWPVIGTPARPITREQPDPSLSMPPRFVLTTPQQRTPAPRAPRPGASGTSSWSPPDAIKRAFSLSLTTTVFSQRSTGRFDALPRRTTPEGQQASISSTAPPINDVSYTTPPSAFVTHGCRETSGDRIRGRSRPPLTIGRGRPWRASATPSSRPLALRSSPVSVAKGPIGATVFPTASMAARRHL